MLKNLFCFVIFIFANLFINISYAQDLDASFGGRREDPDMEALRRWIRTKRMVTVKEIGGDLSLSGEVRTEMQLTHEVKDGIQQRGPNSPTTLPILSYDVEVNIMLDYRSDRTWAAIKLEFDDDMGQTSGTMNKISLERAYFGGRVIDGDTFTFDMEIGRKFLINAFDSRIEFGSLFDGVLFRFGKAFKNIGDYYTSAGVFLINDYYKHYGFVGELGMLDIYNTGLFLKYSFIDWKNKFSTNDNAQMKQRQNLRYNYGNSQLQAGCIFKFPKIKKTSIIYLAGLCNHFAKKNVPNLIYNEKLNLAWYGGMSIGQVKRGGDWALDVNYQWVQAQAVPDFDIAGITRGNAAHVGLYTTVINGAGQPTTSSNAVGSCNYKGWHIEFLYAITGNLTLFQSFEISDNLKKDLGPYIKYNQYEIELIYAF
jgi:hypothetical protein